MKKGFTLIELLAVIIILAVIALIATPLVLNVVEKSKEESRKQSVVGYADAIKLSYAEELLNKTGKPLEELANNKIQGNKVNCNIVKYMEQYGTVLYGCEVIEKEKGIGNYCYISGKIYEGDGAECENVLSIATSGKIEYKTPSITQQEQNEIEYSASKEIQINYPSLKVVEENYYIRSNKSIEVNNVIGKCGNDTNPIECEANNDTILEANTWYQVSGNVTININDNMIIQAVTGKNGFGNIVTYEETKIDVEDPKVTVNVEGKEATFTLTDNIGVIGYGVNNEETVEPTYTEITPIQNTEVKWTATSAGTYYVWVKDQAGRKNKISFIIEQNAFSYEATATTSTYAATSGQSCSYCTITSVSGYGNCMTVGGGTSTDSKYHVGTCANGVSVSNSVCGYGYTVGQSVAYNCKTAYSCPNGGTLSGTTCTKTVYTCPNGGALDGTTCVF